jgi:16S rRNA (cytosine967-C5)-methyltransferase
LLSAIELSQYLITVFVCGAYTVSAVRLMRIEYGGAFADLLNEKGKGSGSNEMSYVERTIGFRTRDLDDRDLRLVTDVVGGTIRWRRYLDHLIGSLCHNERTFRNMEPLLLQILRIGVYEIIKRDMPPYAVVDENVRLAKVALRPGAGDFVNGILRKLVSLKGSAGKRCPSITQSGRG